MTSSAGSGPDLALIHGWGLGSWVWLSLLKPLSRNIRVHLVDLPGYGRAPADAADLGTTAQALLAALPDRVTLCGWSLGGTLAMRAASLAPERIAGLVLVGATPCFTQRNDWQAGQTPELLDRFSASVKAQPEQALQRFVTLLSQGDAGARAITRSLLSGLREAELPDTKALQHGLSWLREVDLRPLASAITNRSLLVHGENDALNPLPAARWLSGHLPDSHLEVFAGVGHVPFLANPDRFVRLLDDFCHASPAPA